MIADSMKITAAVPLMGNFEFHIHTRFDRYISDCLFREKIWEPFETELFRRLCRSGDYVVDIGANIGWYSVIASRIVGPNGRVLAVEPDLVNLQLLKMNIEESGGTSPIEILDIALGDIEGDSELFLSQSNLGDHHLFDDGEPRDSITVRVQTLDAVLTGVSNKPTLIKADSQGSEGRILDGAAKLFAEGWRPLLILEFWPYGLMQSGSDPHDIWKRLDAFGYGIYEFSEGSPRLAKLTEIGLLSRLEGDISPQSQDYVNLLCLPLRDDRLDRVSELVV